MRTIRAARTMQASAERIFDVLADHAGYTRLPGVRAAKVVRPGTSEPNGVGALRRIEVGPAWFEEEITAFERPTLLEYRMIRTRSPIAHELGRVTLTTVPGGVEVVWTSTFRVLLPLIGGLATALAARQMTRDFTKALRVVEELARA